MPTDSSFLYREELSNFKDFTDFKLNTQTLQYGKHFA